jgi:hypothetical protein
VISVGDQGATPASPTLQGLTGNLHRVDSQTNVGKEQAPSPVALCVSTQPSWASRLSSAPSFPSPLGGSANSRRSPPVAFRRFRRAGPSGPLLKPAEFVPPRPRS